MKPVRLLLFLLILIFWLFLIASLYQSKTSQNTKAKTSLIKESNQTLENSTKTTTSTISSTPSSPKAHWETSASCKECHFEVYQEWQASFHSKAWTNPEFQGRIGLYRKADCLPCHIPKPLLTQKNFLIETRNKEIETGISCLTCHQSKEGIASVRENLTHPTHPLSANSALKEDKLCIECHRSIGKTFLKFKQPGQNCRNCHMPKISRKNGTIGFSHLILDRKKTNFMKDILELKVNQQEEHFEVELSNQKIPHNVPGERHFRMLLLFVEIWDSKKEYPIQEFREVVKDISMFRKESLQDKIKPQEHLLYSYPKGGDYAIVRLVYKRFPEALDEEGYQIKRIKVEFN